MAAPSDAESTMPSPSPPEARGRWHVWLRIVRWTILALLAVGLGGYLYLARWPGDGQTPPRGFFSRNEAIAALLVHGVQLVDRNPPIPENVEFHGGVPYGNGGGRPLLLDLCKPRHQMGKAPGLIFIHGGGWKSGAREDYHVYTIWFAQHGYVSATIGYRLSKEARFPAAVEDAKCAVRWMRAEADKLGVDPEKIAVIGGSAGGHLAMMVGYTANDRTFEGTGGHEGVSSAVAAVVELYGPFDFETPEGKSAKLVKDFLGYQSYDEAPEVWKSASPATYLNAGDPPTLILHGTIDEIVPISQGEMLDERLAELSIPHRFLRLEGWPHAMDAAVPVNIYCRHQILSFLHKQLGP
jgi:acetyl esterase/lipase